MRYTMQAQTMIRTAAKIARGMGHSYVGSAHLLLALLEDAGEAGKLLRFAGLERELVRNMAQILLGVGTPELPLPQGFSVQAKRILRNAADEAYRLQNKQVDHLHVLLAILRTERCEAWNILMLNNVDTQDGIVFEHLMN